MLRKLKTRPAIHVNNGDSEVDTKCAQRPVKITGTIAHNEFAEQLIEAVLAQVVISSISSSSLLSTLLIVFFLSEEIWLQ